MAKKIRLTDHTSLDEGIPKHNIRKKINQEKIEKIEKAIEGESPNPEKVNSEAIITKESEESTITQTKVVEEEIAPIAIKEVAKIEKKSEPIKTSKPVAEKKVVAKPKRGRGRPKAEEEGQLTTLRFPSDLYIELKIKAFREKKTFRELVMEGLQHYLKHQKNKAN